MIAVWILYGLVMGCFVWHGWKFEIGEKGNGFYFKLYQYPLKHVKRLFKESENDIQDS